MILEHEFVDVSTPSGPMRLWVDRPAASGRYPGIVLFSEIYQRTEPIARMAAIFAGHGFVVATPEIFHELEPIGTALAYDKAGTDKGNAYKKARPIEAFDVDTDAAIQALQAHAQCSGSIGVAGVCIGGHLAFRAAVRHPAVRAAACFYATDLQNGTLGSKGDDTLARAEQIRGELLLVWGRQDPHIPDEARAIIHRRLLEAKTTFTWLEHNAQHAFMRDIGPRYDPALALSSYRAAIDLFSRTLAAS
jgi:carboxymethylenebutenolidase